MPKKRKTAKPKIASRLFEELRKIRDGQKNIGLRLNRLEEERAAAREKKAPKRKRTLIDDALGLDDDE